MTRGEQNPMIFSVTRFVATLMLAATCTVSASNYSFLKDAPAQHFTEQDMKLFTAAVDDALNHSEDGKITAWRNPETKASGKLKILKTYQSEGSTCRRLQIANQADGRKSNVAFNFCRQADNTWRVVN